MKTPLLSILFCLITLAGFSQAEPTRIFIVKNGAQTLLPTTFYTTSDPNLPIRVRNNGYVVLETYSDSLGIIREVNYADPETQRYAPKPVPVFLKLEKGHAYFFKVGPIPYSRHLDVEEMTERAFWLYVGLNGLNENVKKYELDEDKTAQK